MAEWYTIGLQAGKNVAKKVDECDFTPDRRKVLADSVIYEWNLKWNPYLYKNEKEFIDILKSFDASSDAADAYKLVCVGDEGSEDFYANNIGYSIFEDIYQVHEIVYPESFD